MFDDTHTSIDRCVHNPSRITKVIGTIARKGKESPDRPYRKVTLVSNTSHRWYVTGEMMEALIRGYSKPPKQGLIKQTEPKASPDNHSSSHSPRKVALLLDQLSYIDPNCDYKKWRNVVFSILSTGWPEALSIALQWSESSEDKFDPGGFKTLVDSFKEDKAGAKGPISLGTIWHYAREGGWT